jgi:tetratricopeptide (TPR) repeat protein
VIVTTVFRDRSRGRIAAAGTVREHDQVRPDNSVHLRALLQQVEALRDRGKLSDARDTAERALAWAESAGLARGERRGVLVLLASLEYQTGAAAAAFDHLQSAADTFTAPPAPRAAEKGITENGLAALYLVRGDYPKAEHSLNDAANANPDPLLEAQIRNNLGVLFELRGDSSQAAKYYNEALKSLDRAHASPSPQQRAIEANLARVQRPR